MVDKLTGSGGDIERCYGMSAGMSGEMLGATWAWPGAKT